MIDGCAISLPAHREAPVGLMLAASGGRIAASNCGRHGDNHS
jgi:hypothetical protein